MYEAGHVQLLAVLVPDHINSTVHSLLIVILFSHSAIQCFCLYRHFMTMIILKVWSADRSVRKTVLLREGSDFVSEG